MGPTSDGADFGWEIIVLSAVMYEQGLPSQRDVPDSTTQDSWQSGGGKKASRSAMKEVCREKTIMYAECARA